MAAAAAAGLIALALSWLGWPRLPQGKLDMTSLLEIIKISLAVVAGIGGVVALVVAYRKQRITEAGEAREHARLYAERFDKATDKLGSESPAVRLAGVHALASLADDWPGGRQMCIDVLCAYLRMPPEPEPDADQDPANHVTWRAMREVRATILRLIGTHLRYNDSISWAGAHLDFNGVVFDHGADFMGAQFSGVVSFDGAVFSGGTVSFSHTGFFGEPVSFAGAEFAGATVSFDEAMFSGVVSFDGAEFSSGTVSFSNASFFRDTVSFHEAVFSGGTVSFSNAEFWKGLVSFDGAEFSGLVSFDGAEFSSGTVSFARVKFSSGAVSFGRAEFSGGAIWFNDAEFSGGTVDLTEVADWSHPPAGLPEAAVGLQLPQSVPAETSEPRGHDVRRPETGDVGEETEVGPD
ncbi:pentapeptide repeat-containing protein [Microbispora catharanthi]|uniref:Pentapeptide repeat-containing protein n=2 Tax=Microbispora catharanthi TaxID=1712871 RepID=A0A5N6BJF7_9ACTN|nr:pentapeptide repeat-containing protein [Microbispora catharanthi]